jgi:hypothetical protein
MAKDKDKQKLVKTLKKLSREKQLAREKLVGRPRAKSFGGRPSVRAERRQSKKDIREGY